MPAAIVPPALPSSASARAPPWITTPHAAHADTRVGCVLLDRLSATLGGRPRGLLRRLGSRLQGWGCKGEGVGGAGF